jgi:DHA1 family multidrug resistance protein-like MFS transporter
VRAGPVGADGAPLLRPELVIIVGGLIATAHASMMITIPAFPRFVDALGGSAIIVGFALAVSSVGRFFTNIPAGMLSDKLGRKKIIVAGAFGIGIFATLSGSSTTVPMFLAYRFLIGIFSAMTITVAQTVATDLSTVENRGRVVGMMHGMQLVVGIASPAIGGLIAEVVSIRTPFYVSGVGVLVFAIWAVFRMPETRPPVVPAPDAAPTGVRARRFAWIELLRDRNFLLVCMIGFSTFFLRGGASLSLVPLYADQVLGTGPGLIGLLFTGASLIHGIIIYPAGALADRFGRKPLIVPAGILVGIGFFAFPFASSVALFVLTFMLVHAAIGFGGQAPSAYLGDVSPPALRGLSFGVYRTFGDSAGVLGPLIATGLADAVSFHAAFWFGAGLWTVTVLVFARFAQETAGPRARAVPRKTTLR